MSTKYSLEAAVDHLFQHRAEGIIYASMYHRQVYLPDSLTRDPHCFSELLYLLWRFTSVVPDEELAGEQIVGAMLDKGYRRIAFLNLDERIIAAQGRKAGAIRAYEKRGESLQNLHIEYRDC